MDIHYVKLRLLAATVLVLCSFYAGGCIGASVVPEVYYVTEPENETVAAYRADFYSAVEKIDEYDYEAAVAALILLADKLDDEKSTDVSILRADADYALGRVYWLLGDRDKSYDYYNSAYVYYRDIFGADSPFAADAKLQTAFLLSGRPLMLAAADLEESGADDIYKNIAFALSADAFTDLDNDKEAAQYLKKINTFTEKSFSHEEDEQSLNELYGEGVDISRALGRISAFDQAMWAYKAEYAYYVEKGEYERILEIAERMRKDLTGYDLKSEEAKEEIYSDMAFLKLYFQGATIDNEYLEKALAQGERIYPQGSHLAYVNEEIAEMYAQTGDYENFYKYLLKAQELTLKDKNENNRVSALIKLRMAAYHRHKGENEKAAAEALESVNIYRNLVEDGTSAIGAAYNILANCYTAVGDTKKTDETYEKATDTYRALGMDLELATSLRNRALVLNNTYMRHEEALNLAREAISLVEQMDHNNNSKTIAAIYMVLADILTPADPEYNKIEEYSKKAYECLQNAIGNKDEYMANYYYNYGNYLKDNSRYDEAIENLSSAEEYFKKIYDEEWQYPVDVLFDLAVCLYMKGEYTQARTAFERALDYENEAISRNVSPSWCKYLEENRNKAQEYIKQIDQ